MPKFMDYLYSNFDVKGSKEYWGKLAHQGYVEQLKKGGAQPKNKTRFGRKNTPQKSNIRSKCDHCNKLIGSKVAIQCDGCNNMNLVECLTCISDDRIQDFTLGKDKFICNKCVMQVDTETLNIAPALTHESLDVHSDTSTAKDEEIYRLKQEIKQKDAECSILKSKCDFTIFSFDKIKMKIDTVEKDFKESLDTVDLIKLKDLKLK